MDWLRDLEWRKRNMMRSSKKTPVCALDVAEPLDAPSVSQLSQKKTASRPISYSRRWLSSTQAKPLDPRINSGNSSDACGQAFGQAPVSGSTKCKVVEVSTRRSSQAARRRQIPTTQNVVSRQVEDVEFQ